MTIEYLGIYFSVMKCFGAYVLLCSKLNKEFRLTLGTSYLTNGK